MKETTKLGDSCTMKLNGETVHASPPAHILKRLELIRLLKQKLLNTGDSHETS